MGGSYNNLVTRTAIVNTGYGVNLGFSATEIEYMDPQANPQLYECLNCTVSNCIIAWAQFAGVAMWAAQAPTVVQNTIWQAQQLAQAAILFSSAQYVAQAGKSDLR